MVIQLECLLKYECGLVMNLTKHELQLTQDQYQAISSMSTEQQINGSFCLACKADSLGQQQRQSPEALAAPTGVVGRKKVTWIISLITI